MKYKVVLIVLGLAALLIVGLGALAQDGGDAALERLYVGSVRAPEFPPGLEWINVEAPLTLDGLRGKIVLLDFWTYGCINCIHMIPVLERLEEKYADVLVVIGVHSAKFENEGLTDNLRQIVQRYALHHPVVNDNNFIVWRLYGASGWPTFALISPRGNVVAMQAGEIPFEAFDTFLAGMVAYYDELDPEELDRRPLELALEGASDPGTLLLYPGKVLADEASGRLFITDTGHHRIVIADLHTYEVLDVIGSGARGTDNGAFEEASFSQPQGLALSADGGTLYIADTQNHLVRAADLTARTVRTLAGTGVRGGILRPGIMGGDPASVAVASPWALALDTENNLLHIAMAGTHQLWVLDLNFSTIYASVGSGRESLIDRTLANSELAQPSGLYFTGGLLYFADSESSSIRVADFNSDEVRTVAGPVIGVGSTTERNALFEFGDVDGEVGISRLQHPLGVTGGPDGLIYVADTYNSRIKVIDPADSTITTLFGSGSGGFRDGGPDVADFYEPGGLSYAGGRLYVADTNNHAVRVIDLSSGTVSTVVFPNPQALQIDRRPVTVIGGNAAAGEQITLDPQTVAPGPGELVLSYTLPEGYKINDLAPSLAELQTEGAAALTEDAVVRITEVELRVPLLFSAGEGRITLDLALFYCEAVDESLCFIDMLLVELPLLVDENAEATALTVQRTVVPPQLDG